MQIWGGSYCFPNRKILSPVLHCVGKPSAAHVSSPGFHSAHHYPPTLGAMTNTKWRDVTNEEDITNKNHPNTSQELIVNVINAH